MLKRTMNKRKFRSIAKAVQNKIDQKECELQIIADKARSKVDKNDPDYFGKLISLMNEYTGPLNLYYTTQILKIIREHGDLDDFLEYVFEFIETNNSVDNVWNIFFENLVDLGFFELSEKQNLN